MGDGAVFAIFNLGKKLLAKLQKKSYRKAYVAEHVRRGIAYQIRALRDQRGWKQGELSERMEKPQSVVCRLEDPSYGKVSIQTLLEVAATFDVALQVRFVPFSTFLTQSRDISTGSMRAASFDEEMQSKPQLKLEPMSALRSTGIRMFNAGGVDLPATASTGTAVTSLRTDATATLQ